MPMEIWRHRSSSCVSMAEARAEAEQLCFCELWASLSRFLASHTPAGPTTNSCRTTRLHYPSSTNPSSLAARCIVEIPIALHVCCNETSVIARPITRRSKQASICSVPALSAKRVYIPTSTHGRKPAARPCRAGLQSKPSGQRS